MRAHSPVRRATCALALVAATASILTGCSIVADAFRPGGVIELPSTPEPITEAGVRLPSELRIGDCVGDTGPAGLIDVVPVMPCSDPHVAEAFHEFELQASSLPPDDELWPLVAVECDPAFEDFVGVEWSLTPLDWYYFAPTEESWDLDDDRRVLCLAYDPEGLTTGTFEGAGAASADTSD
ncbi:hypothetical protein [Agromyces mangrovi Wang et al. 2018]|uniref:hypothetical protein n=1 Tax=Agromyces mangrovi TaxID=1858653 RepID=UPI002573C7A1|nr:hypothetical protein [Agromyces mangrovi]BDZ63322.1 hypothetical protein GCM10025877_02600 [Agromyces mangrovi]